MKNLSKYMAVIVLAAAAFAFLAPGFVARFARTSFITPLLGCVMFGMGLTMKPAELTAVLLKPKEVIAGVICQFTIMPFLAFCLVKAFGLTGGLCVGVILTGCCPGGTSSNVITYLSKGNVPLSVGMTAVSTLLAPLLTPLLLKLYAGSYIPVNLLGMFLSIIEVIIIPIAAGLLAGKLFPRAMNRVAAYLPAFSTLVIAMIVMAVVSANAESLRECGALVILAVVLHNLLGYVLGYAAARLLGMSPDKQKAVSVEVGMQNSGLACSLAATHFQALPMAAVPGAVFSVWHNISGALLARLFVVGGAISRRPDSKKHK